MSELATADERSFLPIGRKNAVTSGSAGLWHKRDGLNAFATNRAGCRRDLERSAHAVARRVFKSGEWSQPVPKGTPRVVRSEHPPGFRRLDDHVPANDQATVCGDEQGPVQQSMIERLRKRDDQRIARAGLRRDQSPVRGIEGLVPR